MKAAYQKKWADVKHQLETKGVKTEEFDLFLRIFKQEGQLEAWVKGKKENTYILYKSFPICSKSGVLGPKRAQGDYQVPEGFYDISGFQPYSNYHLALKVSYPNKSDRLKATSKDAGGDIMIHGNCVTIGCIPIQDGPIEELYLLAVEAGNQKSIIPVHIFPFDFSTRGPVITPSANPETLYFWKTLQPAFDHFENKHSLPVISINKLGDYVINSSSE